MTNSTYIWKWKHFINMFMLAKTILSLDRVMAELRIKLIPLDHLKWKNEILINRMAKLTAFEKYNPSLWENFSLEKYVIFLTIFLSIVRMSIMSIMPLVKDSGTLPYFFNIKNISNDLHEFDMARGSFLAVKRKI